MRVPKPLVDESVIPSKSGTKGVCPVSVIIPAYCHPEFLRKAIESVLSQTFHDIEVLVVDDNSNDDTDKVVRSFMDTRIWYFQHPTNREGGEARNTGIRKAHGKYIAFLDDDNEQEIENPSGLK